MISIKLSRTFFTELEQKIQKFTWNHKSCRIAKQSWGGMGNKTKNKTRGITLQDFRHYYKAIGIKRVWYWYKYI